VVLVVWLFWNVDRERLLAQIVQTDWRWLLVSAALGPAGLLARAQRWRYLFPPQTQPPGLVPAMMIGYMVNNILPLRAGELVRVYVVARRWGGHFWTATATLIVERVLDSLCIVLILGVLVFLVPVPRVVEVAAMAILAVDVVGISVLVAIAAAPARCRRIIEGLTRRWPGLRGRLLHGFERFLHGLDGIRARSHMFPLLAWTVVVWLIPAAAAWTGLRAVHLDLPWLAGWVVLAFVGVGISIPAAPGYIGVFHAAAELATRIFGVPMTEGVGFSIVFHAGQIVPVTLLGWLYLLREHMTLGEATHVSVPETESRLR
jgi:glycosyltransferase 2 family protein